MYGLTVLHQFGVPPGHAGERLGPPLPGLPCPVVGVRLPGRPVHPPPAALLDDSQVAVPVRGLDVPGVESRGGQGQQLVPHELDGRHPGQPAGASGPGPEQFRVDAPAAGGLEVLGRGGEGHPRPHRTGFLRESPHKSVVERGVGDHIGDGRARGQHPVLHPQVRDAVREPVHRTVPPVDRAVVQDELLEPRHPAAVEDPQRVLLVADGQQRGKVADVLLEELVHRIDPPLAEPRPRPHPLVLEFGRPGVRGLLEEGWPRLAPQLPAEQEGGIGAHGHLNRRDGLGRVPHVREAFRSHLQMQLHRGAGRLRRDRTGGAHQSLHAFDIQGEIFAARRHHLIVQQRVAVHVREVGPDHVLTPKSGKYSDHHDPGVDLGGLAVGISETGPQLFGQLVQNAA